MKHESNDLTNALQTQTLEHLRHAIKLSEYPIVIGTDYFCINYTYAGTAKKIEFHSQLETAKFLTEHNIVDGFEVFDNGIAFIDYKLDHYEIEGRGWQERETYTTYTWQDLQRRIAFQYDFMHVSDIMDIVVAHELDEYAKLSQNHAMKVIDALFGNILNPRA